MEGRSRSRRPLKSKNDAKGDEEKGDLDDDAPGDTLHDNRNG